MAKTFTNTLKLNSPFTLIIGSDVCEISKPAVLTCEREHDEYTDIEGQFTAPVYISPRPTHELVTLTVDGSPFAVAEQRGADVDVYSVGRFDNGKVFITLHPDYTRVLSH